MIDKQECCINEYLKENKVIHIQTATDEELLMLMKERENDMEPTAIPNPDLVDYDPVSRYVNW